MTLRKAFSIYAACLAGAVFVLTPAAYLLMSLCWSMMERTTRIEYGETIVGLFMLMVVVLHFAIGVYLNRKVLRQLTEWHVFATLGGISSEKLSYAVFWPFRYLLLFFRLAVAKHL
jgi:hypothetical protein